MALEWLRRTDPKFAQHLKTFLFTEGPITEIEAEMVHGQGGGEAGGSSDGGRGGERRQPGHRQPAQGRRRQMNHLFRERAPITPAGWEEIEKEARRTLRALLAARRVVDFKGPLGLGRLRCRARPRRSDRLAAQRQGCPGPPAPHPAAGRAAHPLRREPRGTRRDRSRRARSRSRFGDGGGARDRDRRGPLDLPRLPGRADHRHLREAQECRRAAGQQPCRLSARGRDGAHQAARRGHRGPLRRRAERAALQGPRRRAPTAAIRSSATSSAWSTATSSGRPASTAAW